MKKPEEIKKGLECCTDSDGCYWDNGCPYGANKECSCDLKADALAYIQQLEAQVPRWIPVEERLPEKWRANDKERTLINYLVYMPEYGVDVGNWVKNAKMCVVMGLPAKVTHWMPLPEAPKEDAHD